MSLAIGAFALGRYQVTGRLGRGAIGEVFAAVDRETGAPVAVKLLALQEASVAARFVREATFMARIRHPNVVQIVDFGTLDDETPCIVMERVEGRSMEERLRDSRALPWPEAVAMLRAVLDGLDAIHGAGVLHRDLKPANVMEEAETGAIKVLDFGIAKAFAGAARGTRLTQSGTTVGTPAYMAPEQFAGTPEIRSDLYSAGIMLYELLTGDVPFGTLGEAAITRRIFEAIPPPVAPARFPKVPDMLSQLVIQSLAPRITGRLSSAREFSGALGFCLRLAHGENPTENAGTLRLEPEERKSAANFVAARTRTLAMAPGPAAQASQLLIVARFSLGILTDPAERTPLAALVTTGTAANLDGRVWLALVPDDGESAARVLTALATRFGTRVRTLARTAPAGFTLPKPGELLAPPIPELIERLRAFVDPKPL
jgi:serine/threonine-protein kinase